MTKKTKLITDTDMERLSSILKERVQDRATAIHFDDMLGSMNVINREETPPDLVTMNSMIRGTIQSNDDIPAETSTFTLVYPRVADIAEGRISIFTPFGIQLLGSRCGDIVNWRGHDGDSRKLLIEEVVYQPEASGDWRL